MAAETERLADGAGRGRLRRRGLIAGAATLVAGIAAKQTAQPVAAFTIDNRFSADGSTGIGFDAYNNGAFETGVAGKGSTQGVLGSGDGNTGLGVKGQGSGASQGVYGIGGSSGGVGVQGGGGGGGAGVYGIGGNNSGNGVVGLGGGPDGNGMRGDATGNGTGVYGSTTGNGQAKGVHGYATSGYGVYGQATASNGYGVAGVSLDSYGVIGTTNGAGPAVYGQNNSHLANRIGVQGYSGSGGYGVLGTSINGIGVSGQVTGGYGVYGTSAGIAILGASTGGYGILGSTTAGAPYSGITGTVTTATGAAFAGGSSTPGAFAAYFTGKVNIDGTFYVNGTQRFTLKHADGTQRLVHSATAVERMVEDFGTGMLANGKASVALDADFAALVETGDYLVFLTPFDGVGALRAARRTAAGFAVEEIGGASGGAFAWRVVGRPKDAGGKAQRLAKYEQPDIKIPGINGVPLPDAPPAPPEPTSKGAAPSPPGPPNPAPPARAIAPTAAPSAAPATIPTQPAPTAAPSPVPSPQAAPPPRT